MPSCRIGLIAACLLFCGLCLHAQEAAAPQKASTVVFKLSWDRGLPWSDFVVTVAEDGATHFKGITNPAGNGTSETVEQDFRMSDANVQKVFEWAKAADYFQGQFETKTKNVAKTGTKTLEFHSPTTNTSTTFNFSPNPNIQQITRLFQSIAVTMDYGR